MERTNWTDIEFILQGTFWVSKSRKTPFVVCLLMYLVILLGNSTLITLTLLDSHLHTPMYFFLCNLSFLDIWYTSSFIPPMLIYFLSEKKTISFTRCVVQMSVLHNGVNRVCTSSSDGIWPLHSHLQPSQGYPYHHEQGTLYSDGSSLLGTRLFNSIYQTILAVQLPFCGKNVINHFI